MKILLAYSKSHFDPSKKPGEQKYWGSSANILARTLYKQCQELGDVTYVDSWTDADIDPLKGLHFDVLVGIVDKFAYISQLVNADKKILFAVNCHPNFRNAQLTSFVERYHLSEKSLSDWDIVTSSYEEGVKAADSIICVGDNVTLNSYVAENIPKQKIKVLDYGVGKDSRVSKAAPNRFVYVSPDIGLRKGFDILYDIFTHPSVLSKNIKLDIIGPATNPHYQKKLALLSEIMGSKLTYHDWLPATSKKYNEVLSEATYLVFPSLEEGQAGTVLDALKRGIVPITTKYVGVPFSPLGFLDAALSSESNVWLILEAIKTSKARLAELRKHTREYYDEFHADFETKLNETLHSAITTGKLYPKISIVLPIFNKQDTIEDLLYNLDRACNAYGNCEIHIIFDGCKDHTEKRVRSFYKNRKKYPVTYEKTPNIFEVKTNNIGLRKSKGKYAVIIQDDNFIYDPNIFFEISTLLDKNQRIAIMGGLAGVNFYPLGTKLSGDGQIAMNKNEVYWRQDANTNPELRNRYFEVDACMRGPLVFRKSFLEEHGYLDEEYAPFYMDDMDICIRAKKLGFHVYAALLNVENKSLTVASYNTQERKDFWQKAMDHSSKIFYSRWKLSTEKKYNWIYREPLIDSADEKEALIISEQAWKERMDIRERRSLRKVRILRPAVKVKHGASRVARRIKKLK